MSPHFAVEILCTISQTQSQIYNETVNIMHSLLSANSAVLSNPLPLGSHSTLEVYNK